MLRIALLTSIILAFFTPSIYAQQHSQEFLIVNDNGLSGLTLEYNLGDPITNTVEVDGVNWTQIGVDGFTHTRERGKPQLPAQIQIVAIPEGADISVTAEVLNEESYNFSKIHPALRPATDRYGDPEPEFEFDAVCYSTNEYVPEAAVSVVDIQELRGIRLAYVRITPMAYNPVTGDLKFKKRLKINITFTPASRFIDVTQHSERFLNSFPYHFVNSATIYEEIESQLNSVSFTPAVQEKDYIIIADSTFITAAEKMADWKRQMGFKVELLASSSWTVNDITNAVHTRYNNWTVKPDYLLIIGDHQFVPARMLYNPDNELYGTDLHYVTMGGINDFVPEMAKGRLSVSSATEAMTVVNKIIDYEKTPVMDTSFYQTGLNCAQFQDDDNNSYADRRFTHTSEEVRNYVMSQGYTVNRVYYANTSTTIPMYYNGGFYSNGQSLPSDLLASTFNWSGNSTQIRNKINQGAFYVLHRDHGYAGGSGWHAPHFTSGNVAQLTNGNKTPVVFSINCHTGEFTLSECFAEKFQRHSNGGAVGVVGASYYSYSGWNDGFSTGMFDAMWASPGLLPNFGSGGKSSPVIPAHGNIRRMGDVVNQGLFFMTKVWTSGSTSNEYTYRLFHYFGDPSMRIRTEMPTAITATHDDSISCSVSSFAVTSCDYATGLATLSIPGQMLGKVQLNNGAGSIPVSSFASNFVILTIDGPEHIPYIDTIWVIPGPLSISHSKTDVKCKGSLTGKAELHLSCGSYPYQISWSNGDTTDYIENVAAGLYHYTVTDQTGYSYSDSVEIGEPATMLSHTATVKNTSCYFGTDGEIDIAVTGGVHPYSYVWSNGYYTQDLSGLVSKNYVVTITDDVGCKIIDTIAVDEPDPLVLSVDVGHDSTNTCTGQATVFPVGGTPPYTYLWNDPDSQITQTAIDLCPGLVKVYVTDVNQCKTVKTTYIYDVSSVNELEADEFVIYPNPLGDQFLNITADKDVAAGEYNITVVDFNGRVVYNKDSWISPQENLTIDLQNLSTGTYLIKISDNESLIKQSVIVKL